MNFGLQFVLRNSFRTITTIRRSGFRTQQRIGQVSIPDISIDFAGDKSPAQGMQVG